MRRHLITACWILLGAALLAPRIAVLHQGLWHDEIYTVQQYVSGRPAAIFGHYDANDHMLFSVLAWLTVRVPGGPDVAYRLWGIVPFLAAVATTALWLRARANLASALVFTTLAASSARLLELTSEARGYGLAYFAMSILVIACYEARATGRRAWLTVLCVAGVAGVWTIPTFVLPAVGAAAAL